MLRFNDLENEQFIYLKYLVQVDDFFTEYQQPNDQ